VVQISEQKIAPIRGASLWPVSVEAYHVLGEAGVIPQNTELLYGLVYKKMPKSPFHTFLLYWLLEQWKLIALPGRWLRSEQPLTFSDSEPEPDISVVRGSVLDYPHSHPKTADFVVEICVTSHDYDRSKVRAYAMAGIKEYWLVLGPEKQIEVHRDPKDGAFAQVSIHGPSGTLESLAVPELSVDLDQLFQTR
jgi:Uma2 family endonuclease